MNAEKLKQLEAQVRIGGKVNNINLFVCGFLSSLPEVEVFLFSYYIKLLTSWFIPFIVLKYIVTMFWFLLKQQELNWLMTSGRATLQ